VSSLAAAGTDQLFAKFCTVIGLEGLTGDPRFATNPLRTQNRRELNVILEPVLKSKTTAEWERIFEGAGVPYSPINDLRQICEDPHIRHRGMLAEIDQPTVGKLRIVNSPIRLSETPGEVYAPAPLLGQHTEAVLREVLGYSPGEIEGLREAGVINRSV